MDRHLFTTGVLAVLAQRQRSLDERVTKLSDERGPEGPVGPAPAHRWRGTKLAFEKPDGKWGAEVDLRGPGGGVAVVGGSGAAATSPPAPRPKNKRISYDEAGRVSRVDSFEDPQRTQLHSFVVLTYASNGALASSNHFDAAGALIKTVDMVWQGSTLDGVTTTPAT